MTEKGLKYIIPNYWLTWVSEIREYKPRRWECPKQAREYIGDIGTQREQIQS